MRLSRSLAFLAAVLALALPAAADAAQPAVNVAGAPTQPVIAEALSTGAKQVRVFVLWQDFEPDSAAQYPPPARPANASEQNLSNLSGAFDAAIRQLNAAGAEPIFVVVGAPQWASGSSDWHVPPREAGPYAQFFSQFVTHNTAVGRVAAYEIWNEADESSFWSPAPDSDRYAAMVKATYTAAKPHAGDAAILVGPFTGSNFPWLERLYDAGIQGHFDGVAVHNDGACADHPPDFFLRDQGRISRYMFLAYREIRATMAARGDRKPIWITELGWSSTNGGPTSCTRGAFAGQKPDGVSEADQAAFLTMAFGCMANDPEVVSAAWFTMRDARGQPLNENNHYGLVRSDGTPKPSLAAFKTLVATNGGAAAPCGDFSPPAIKVLEPLPGQQYVHRVDVKVAAVDGGVGVSRVAFAYDRGTNIRSFGATDGLRDGTAIGLAPWYGSSLLALGPHVLEVIASDKNGNESRVEVPIVKVDPATVLASVLPAFKIKPKVKCVKRNCKVVGGVNRSVGGPPLAGRVEVLWQVRGKAGWIKAQGGSRAAHPSFDFKLKAKVKGRWRVKVSFLGQAPYKSTASKFLYFRIKR